MADQSHTEATFGERFKHELWLFLGISLYLFAYLSVLLVFQASQSPGAEVTLAALGMALVKALILGKFILIGEAFKPGTRVGAPTLLHRLAWRTLGMLFLLIILKLLEELIVGLVHGERIAELVGELAGQSWVSLAGPILMMLMVLIPVMAVAELNRALGEVELGELLVSRERQ